MPFIIVLHDSSVCCGSPWETLVLRGCGVHGALPGWPPVGLGIVCPAALTSACACGAGECLSSRLSGELTSIHISPEPSLKRANPTACGVSLGRSGSLGCQIPRERFLWVPVVRSPSLTARDSGNWPHPLGCPSTAGSWGMAGLLGIPGVRKWQRAMGVGGCSGSCSWGARGWAGGREGHG